MSIRYLLSRSANLLRCAGSYVLSLCGIVRVRHLPVFLSIEPANYCQLHCPECPVGKAKKDGVQPRLLSDDVWRRVMAEAISYVHTIQFYFQGEPLFHPRLPQMIGDAHKAGIYTIVSTNAQSMTAKMAEDLVESGLNRIIISMDGMTEQTYSAYRIGGSLHKTKESIRLLQAAKQVKHRFYPIIELQCLRLSSNEHEWAAFRKEYKRIGADKLSLKTAQLYDYAHGHPLMPTQVRYSRYVKGEDGLYHVRQSWWRKWLRYRPCYRLWAGCVVSTIGDILPCCYDKEHRYTYGNILETSLAEAWQKGKATAFRRKVIDRLPIDICTNCLH